MAFVLAGGARRLLRGRPLYSSRLLTFLEAQYNAPTRFCSASSAVPVTASRLRVRVGDGGRPESPDLPVGLQLCSPALGRVCGSALQVALVGWAPAGKRPRPAPPLFCQWPGGRRSRRPGGRRRGRPAGVRREPAPPPAQLELDEGPAACLALTFTSPCATRAAGRGRGASNSGTTNFNCDCIELRPVSQSFFQVNKGRMFVFSGAARAHQHLHLTLRTVALGPSDHSRR